jgi:molybdopterin molybdotransferase
MLRAMAECAAKSLGSPSEGVGLILPRVRAVGVERVPLERAIGRVLAEGVTADRDSPAADVSAMDGFAVRAADLALGELPIAGELRIGQEPMALPARSALRIVTGAPVPPGADVVVKREDTEEASGRVRFAAATKSLPVWTNIRRKGENAKAGEAVVAAGAEVTAPVAGVLAACGRAEVPVHRRVRVAVLVTGDEVLGVGDTPGPYQLRDSNGYTVLAIATRWKWVEAERAPAVKDDPGVLRSVMRDLLVSADALIVTGGVSMGERDFVPRVVRDLGAEVLFHKVNQRPGKPVFAAAMEGKPIFGLPGNPLSVMVTMRRMVVPVLERLGGIQNGAPPALMRLVNPDDRRLDMWWHRFVKVVGEGRAELLSISSSGDVMNAARSDGFVELPPGAGGEGPWGYYSWV